MLLPWASCTSIWRNVAIICSGVNLFFGMGGSLVPGQSLSINLVQCHPVRSQLASLIKARWVCEQAHQQLKEELGLDHFEGRSWRGLHRHTLMTLIAYLFLQHLRLQAATGGEKKDRRTSTAPDTADHPAHAA
jgi:SRSO17 transposase